MKVQLIVALIGVALSSGCVLAPAPYSYSDGVAVEGVVVDSAPPVDIYEPSVIIVENGIRHDRYYYQRHPDVYRYDMRRYPDRFHRDHYGPGPRFHGPDPRFRGPDSRFHGPDPRFRRPDPRFQGPTAPSHRRDESRNAAPEMRAPAPGHAMQRDNGKKKKHHDDDHR